MIKLTIQKKKQGDVGCFIRLEKKKDTFLSFINFKLKITESKSAVICPARRNVRNIQIRKTNPINLLCNGISYSN